MQTLALLLKDGIVAELTLFGSGALLLSALLLTREPPPAPLRRVQAGPLPLLAAGRPRRAGRGRARVAVALVMIGVSGGYLLLRAVWPW